MPNRRVFMGVGSLLLAGSKSVGYTPAEKSNLHTVREFLSAWNRPDLNIDALLEKYMAPNAAVRWFDGEPPAIGPKAAAESARKTAGDQLRVAIEILDMFAHGPLVATSRIDTVKVPGKPDMVVKTAGFHLLRNGKFEEYADFTAD